jgi:hypothetical protein
MFTNASSEKRETRPRSRSSIRDCVTPQWLAASAWVQPRCFTESPSCRHAMRDARPSTHPKPKTRAPGRREPTSLQFGLPPLRTVGSSNGSTAQDVLFPQLGGVYGSSHSASSVSFGRRNDDSRPNRSTTTMSCGSNRSISETDCVAAITCTCCATSAIVRKQLANSFESPNRQAGQRGSHRLIPATPQLSHRRRPPAAAPGKTWRRAGGAIAVRQ